MSGTTLTAAQQVRYDVFFGAGTLSGVGDFNYAGTLTTDGSANAVATAADTFLMIDTVAGVTAAADLFVSTGFNAIENMNDLSPIIVTGADSVAGNLVYQGDSGGQTFYAGTGTESAAFVGFGNTFATPAMGGGTYEVSAGLVANQLQTLATPTSTADGNNVAIASGNASIAAGLGYNHIFLGTGTALVANEGNDTIVGSSGADTINGAGAATVFAGAGSTTYDGAGGTALIIGGTAAGSGTVDVYGGIGSVTVYGGSGDEAAFGGTAGNNVLVSGSGNASLVGGGGNNDLLVASGAGTTSLIAGSGNETLFGAGASGTTNFFLGSGSDTVVAGTGSEYIQFGSGFSTVVGSTGADVYGLNASIGGSTDVVTGFNASSDYLELQGFGSSVTAASFFANDVSTVNGSTEINLTSSTGDLIQLYGVTNLTAANFIVPSVSGAG